MLCDTYRVFSNWLLINKKKGRKGRREGEGEGKKEKKRKKEERKKRRKKEEKDIPELTDSIMAQWSQKNQQNLKDFQSL